MQPNDKQKTEDQFFDEWVQSEIWFMRGTGLTLLVIAALSALFGLFATSEDQVGTLIVQGLNGIVVFLTVGAGIWALWLSTREVQMVQLVEQAMQRQPSRAFVVGGIQVVLGFFFMLSGLRDSLPMLLLGLMVVAAGAWFIYRGMRVREYRSS